MAKDSQRLAAYIERAGPVIRESGGRSWGGDPARAFEAGVVERTVVIELDRVEQAVRAYESPGNQEALRTLGDSAKRDPRIIEGVL